MKMAAGGLRVSRSKFAERLKGTPKTRGSYLKADDAELLLTNRGLVDARLTYGGANRPCHDGKVMAMRSKLR